LSNLKYSRQRESIKEYLNSTNEHPTADTVYMNVRQLYPNISLGTVYRNLGLLTELNEARKVPTPEGRDRFEANMTPHNHFFCNECGKIIDLDINIEHLSAMESQVCNVSTGYVESSNTTFSGKCVTCVS